MPGTGAGFRPVGTTFGAAGTAGAAEGMTPAAGGAPGIGGLGMGGGIIPGAPMGGMAGLGAAGIPGGGATGETAGFGMTGTVEGGTTGEAAGFGAAEGIPAEVPGGGTANGFLSSKASNMPPVVVGGFKPERPGAAGAEAEGIPGIAIGALGTVGIPGGGAGIGDARETPGAGVKGGLMPGAVTGGTLPDKRASNTPGPPGTAGVTAGLGTAGGVNPGTAGLGMPGTPNEGGGGGAGFAVPGTAKPGTAGLGIPAGAPKVGVTPGLSPGAVTEGEGIMGGGGTSPCFFIFVGKVKIILVPGSAFSATAPPPWAARIVFTRANLSPVPANWGEAGCFGS